MNKKIIVIATTLTIAVLGIGYTISIGKCTVTDLICELSVVALYVCAFTSVDSWIEK